MNPSLMITAYIAVVVAASFIPTVSADHHGTMENATVSDGMIDNWKSDEVNYEGHKMTSDNWEEDSLCMKHLSLPALHEHKMIYHGFQYAPTSAFPSQVTCPDGLEYQLTVRESTEDPGHNMYTIGFVPTKDDGTFETAVWHYLDCDGMADVNITMVALNCISANGAHDVA